MRSLTLLLCLTLAACSGSVHIGADGALTVTGASYVVDVATIRSSGVITRTTINKPQERSW